MQYKFDKPINGLIGKEKYQCTIEWRNGKFISESTIFYQNILSKITMEKNHTQRRI